MRRLRSAPQVALVAALSALSLYVGAYVAARATHRLVRYGGFIARPNELSGIGSSLDEIAFAPLVWLELEVRAVGTARRP